MAVLPQKGVPVKIGRYRIINPLGQGGMGSVYLAEDTELDRQVALKIPHISDQDSSSVLERFYREARAAATLRHPHICPLFDIGEFQGTPYLTMAYIEGKSLSEFARSKPLTQRSIAILVRKLALALQEAHQRGIIHRDLKPANIMIDKRGEPIVMDFGLARRISRDDTRLTQTGAAIGTPAYMPPEQISANAELMGPACDVYSLGVILYELLTGRLPFEGDAMAMLAQILTDEPRRPSELQPNIDPALETICLRAMAKKPADRFGSMTEMAARLMDYLKGKTPEPPALATVVPVAAETKPSGIHLSALGGLRSMAQAGMQMRPPKPVVEGAPLKRKRRKQKLPAWVWVSVGGGAVAVLIAIIAIIWSVSGSATARSIPTAPEAAAFVAPEKSRDSQDPKEPAQRTESPEPNRTEPDGAPPSTPPTPIVGAKAVPEAPSATSGLAALQGEWLVLSEEWKGKPLGDAVTQRQGKYLHFDGDRMTFTRNGPEGKMTSQGKIRVEGGAFEFSGLDYFGKPRELRGIFALTGDTLRLAYPNTNKGLIRPTAFESTAMDDTLVIVAKRKPADIAQKPIDPDRAPKSIAVPQIVQHKTFSWDKSKTNYARYEDRVFDVGLGNEAPGWGTGVAGVELENVRHLQLSVTFSGKFKYMDVNSLAGFLIDYGTGAGYTKRVSLHTGISDRKHFASWPNWGKGKAPDTYISVGTQKTYDIDFQTWAPTGWDGRVWFSAIVSNTGDRTRIVARITGME